MAQRQPEEQSAQKLLPKFAGNPPCDPEQCKEILHKVVTQKTGFQTAPPSWEAFQKVVKQPQKKAAGPDQVAPHLVSWLPLDLQWEVYQAVLEVWVTGEIPQHWLEGRITLLYKRGDPSQAANYRPIAVSGAMYLILAQLLLGALKDPIEQSLSARQAGGKKGKTPAQHALAMLTRLHAKDNEEAYVCLIDIAKAYPSMPHPAITYALQATGTPQHLIKMIRGIYHRST